jgi:iron complex outermembrane receptor protein
MGNLKRSHANRLCGLRAVYMAALALSITVFADETKPVSDSSAHDTASAAFELGKVTVTGKAEKESFENITAADMASRNKTDVAKALDLLPGLALVNMGPRNESNVYIRGFNSLQATMFLDGIPVYVPYDGNIDLARFTTFDISQISVEKGAVSTMYGPNTMGGVINIVTRKPTAPLDLSVETGWKGRDGGLVAANIGTRMGNFYALGSGSYLNQNRVILSSDFKPTKFQPSEERGNSYQEDWKASIKAGYENPSVGEFSIIATSQNGRKGTPLYAGTDSASTASVRFWKWPYYDKTSIYSINKINLGSIGYLKVPLYYDRFENSLFAYDDTTYSTMKKRSSFKSNYDDFSAGGSVEFGTGIVPNDSLKIGVQYKDDNHFEGNTTNDTSRASGSRSFVSKPDIRFRDYTVSLNVENAYTIFDRLTVVPGGSVSRRKAMQAQNLTEPTPYHYAVTDFPMEAETGWNLQLASFFAINKANTINASVSRRARFPSIKDRYSYRLGTAIPNPGLKSENAVQGELGYLGEPVGNLVLQLSGFAANLDDVIQMVSSVGPNNESQMRNAGEARFFGYEFGARYTVLPDLAAFKKVTISVNSSFIKRRNLTNPSLLFTDVPDHKSLFSFEYSPVEFASLLWTTEFNSQRYSSSDGKRVASASVVEDIRAQASFSGITLNAGVNNILDANYSLLEGYPEPGRNYYTNLSYDFKLKR